MSDALQLDFEHLDFVLKSSGVGVWRVDLRGGTMTCTSSCKANFGFEPDEHFRYADLESLIHPEDFEGWSREVHDAIEQVRDFELEYRITTRQGEPRRIFVHGQVAMDGDGKAEHLSGITQNVTHRKPAGFARSIHRPYHHAEKGDLSRLSRELRAPLDTILDWIRVLRDGRQSADESAHILDAIERCTREQRLLVDDLLKERNVSSSDGQDGHRDGARSQFRD